MTPEPGPGCDDEQNQERGEETEEIHLTGSRKERLLRKIPGRRGVHFSASIKAKESAAQKRD